MDSLFDITNNKFYPEDPEGNIEYKWRLDTKNNMGQKKLLTQMMWRINEGYENTGEKIAYYLLGVYDNGDLGGLTVDELIKSINILKDVVKFNNELQIVTEDIKQIRNSYIYYCQIKLIKTNKIYEKKIIVIGELQSGKTTLISQLCYNSNHKSYVLKHVHEKITGTTTDIKKEIIGIHKDNIINYSDYGGWDDIVKNSDIILNIYDIPVTNIKVIINYLLGINPDYMFICYKTDIKQIEFYIDFCKYYNINYNIIDYNKIKNYDREYFNNILLNIASIKCNDNSDNLIDTENNTSIFRVIDNYDICEKGRIVTGIQINKHFIENDRGILVSGNNKYDIIIKSIYKKTIKYDNIISGESGSFNIDIINDDKKIKINKNSYIIDKIKTYNNKIIRIHLNKNINNGIYNIILFNGNFMYDIFGIEIEDNIIIINTDDYYLQDKKIIICMDYNISFDNIVCGIKLDM